MSDPQEILPYEEKKTAVDPNKVLTILYRRWHVIAATLAISFLIAYLHLRYTKPLYTAVIKLKLDDERPSQMSDLFKYGRTTGRFDNFLKTETEIIKSIDYAERALQELDYEYAFFAKGKIVSSEVYPNPYFLIRTIYNDPLDKNHNFIVEYVNPKQFRIKSKDNLNSQILYSI